MDLFNDSILYALCRTFAHSLWQGLILALITGAVIQLTRNKTAAFRYNLLSLLLLCFLTTVTITLLNEFNNSGSTAVNTERSGLSETNATENYTPEKTAPLAAYSLLTDIRIKTNRFLYNNAGFIVGFWFLIFCFKCLNTLNGLKYIYRIRNYQVSEPEEFWQKKVSEMQQQLKISLRVKILESRLVDIPAVTGFLKPVILLPIGMLNNLPVEQVEAILLHELAHIRRADYVLNLLQRFVEILFFFNPGVLWLSSVIKDERENCCDDIAVSITGNKKDFVEALVSFQEYRHATSVYSLGLSNGKSNLIDRSKRLLYSNNRLLNTMEKSALSVCLVLLAATSFAFYGMDNSSEKTKTIPAATQSATVAEQTAKEILFADRNYDPDEIPEGTSIRFTNMVNGHSQPTWIFKSNDTLYQISGDIRLFKINGEIIPQERYKPYLPKIRELMSSYRKQEAMLTRYIDDKRGILLADNRKVKSKKEDQVTTTVTTTITTTLTELGTITNVAVDSSVIRSCLSADNNIPLAQPLLTVCTSGAKSFNISYPQNFEEEVNTCRK